jgi:aspartate/methionine/tyrosine aminotransferase
MVCMGDVNPTSVEAVKQYEATLLEAEREGTRIRAILLASPHNPLGRPYDVAALEGYLKLCSKYNIHLMSDEVYAKAIFPSQDIPNPPPFVSVLSLDLEKFINPSLVHVLYGMSKDWCANGTRAGAIITPHNSELMKALGSIASFTRASSMAEQAWLNVLNDEEWLASYFRSFTAKMTTAYDYCAKALKENNIPYSPVSAASFIWLDLSRYLEEDTAEAELELGWKMVNGGVWLGLGQAFRSEKHGNFRLTFATPEADVKLGMERYDVMPLISKLLAADLWQTCHSSKRRLKGHAALNICRGGEQI